LREPKESEFGHFLARAGTKLLTGENVCNVLGKNENGGELHLTSFISPKMMATDLMQFLAFRSQIAP